MNWAIELAERGAVPDPLIRFGIRRLLARRLAAVDPGTDEARGEVERRFVAGVSAAPIAVATDAANEQHYEVPPEFFVQVLGKHLKYSSCYWAPGVDDLDAAEAAMLELTARRAGVEDGMTILDLGCGWGSLSLWLAERLPASRLLAVSNSRDQRAFIEQACRERGLTNLEVRTEDVNHLALERRFDRVISVEMFEHTQNQPALLERIAGWLEPGGRLFVHVFCHRHVPYLFEVGGSADWMARYFFTGGIMPSADLLRRFDRHLEVEEQWAVDGRHYESTARAWLENLDRRRDEVRRIFLAHHAPEEAERWIERWRLFFLACAELFGYRGGSEWQVAHYRLRPTGESGGSWTGPTEDCE